MDGFDLAGFGGESERPGRDLKEPAASVRLSQGSTPSLMDVLRQAEINLVILALMLPGRSSFDLCGDVRAASQVPIMMLTARSEESDRAGGGRRRLRHKAVQPARIARARQGGPAPIARDARLRRRRRGRRLRRLETDLRRRELTSPLGAQVDLSTGEFDLLVAFVEHANRVLSREALMQFAKTRRSDDPSTG